MLHVKLVKVLQVTVLLVQDKMTFSSMASALVNVLKALISTTRLVVVIDKLNLACDGNCKNCNGSGPYHCTEC